MPLWQMLLLFLYCRPRISGFSWSVAQVALTIAASMVVFILAAVAVLETAFRYEMRHGASDGDSWKRVMRYTICPLCCLGLVILPIIVPLGAWVGEYARQRSYSTEELRSVNAATEVVTNILGRAAATVVPADVGRRRPWLYGLIDRGVETYSRLLPGAEEDTSSVDRASASYSVRTASAGGTTAYSKVCATTRSIVSC